MAYLIRMVLRVSTFCILRVMIVDNTAYNTTVVRPSKSAKLVHRRSIRGVGAYSVDGGETGGGTHDGGHGDDICRCQFRSGDLRCLRAFARWSVSPGTFRSNMAGE